MVGEATACGGEGVAKREDRRGGAAGRAHEGPDAGRVRRGFHHARILTDVDERPGGQLQPKVMQVAWCDVGFGAMLGPLSQGALPPALAVGSQPVRQHRAGDLVRSDGHQPPQSASTSRVVGKLGAMGEGAVRRWAA